MEGLRLRRTDLAAGGVALEVFQGDQEVFTARTALLPFMVWIGVWFAASHIAVGTPFFSFVLRIAFSGARVNYQRHLHRNARIHEYTSWLLFP